MSLHYAGERKKQKFYFFLISRHFLSVLAFGYLISFSFSLFGGVPLSYLEDPRVFWASERTLLAWIRTELAILIFAFFVKKILIEDTRFQSHTPLIDVSLYALCGVTVFLSFLTTIQIFLSMKQLGQKEIPSPLSAFIVKFTAIFSFVLSVVTSLLIILI